MKNPRFREACAFVLPCAFMAACSTIDGGGTGSDAGVTSGPVIPVTSDGDGADDTDGEPPLGPEDYDYCTLGPEGSDWFMGWQITCNATSATRTFVNPFDDTLFELEDISGPFGSICCGGIALEAEADLDCQTLCMEQICEAARVQHVAWALDVSNDGAGGDCLDYIDNCGFDLGQCMSGMLHEQVANPGALFSYILQAECEAAHDQVISPYSDEYDWWKWVEFPNDPNNDPAPLCAPIPPPEPGLPEKASEHEVGEEPGTSITLQWSVGDGPPSAGQSLDAEVDLAYAVNPCAEGDCIGLSRLHVTIPDGTYQGFELQNLHLIVEEASQEVPLSASGAFSFSSRALRATLSLSVAGIPLVITGYNEGRALGVALPHANTMTLTNLVFGFDDGAIDAVLALNINGTYVRHGPDAMIKVLDAPTDCAMPVTFEAASNDLDGDSMTHMWWVPPWFLGTGNLLDAALPAGTYRVYLTSSDSSGRSDSTALQYVRTCR
jgi:hypothetical protein